MLFTGVIALGLFTMLMVLMVRSVDRDHFNWPIILWIFGIELPRIAFFFLLFKDSIYYRKLFAMVLFGTTMFEVILTLIFNMMKLFKGEEEYCDKIFAVWYMTEDWNISCTGAVIMF